MRRVELLGEAAKRLPLRIKNICPSMQWKEIAGMRYKLIHAYMWIDLDLVWEVTQSEIEPLEECLKQIKEQIAE